MIQTLLRIPFLVNQWVDKYVTAWGQKGEPEVYTLSSLETALVWLHMSPDIPPFFHLQLIYPHIFFKLKCSDLYLFLPLVCLSCCLPIYYISLSPSRYLLSRPVGIEYVTSVWVVSIILPLAIRCHFECLNAPSRCIISPSFFQV